MGASLAPHVMLAVMWAALANTVPAAFWSVAFLLLPEHARHRQRCLEALPFKSDIPACVQVSKQAQDMLSSQALPHRPLHISVWAGKGSGIVRSYCASLLCICDSMASQVRLQIA